MKQNFVQGAMILVAAGLITRGLGTIYRIFLSRVIGPEAIGLYQMAFPTLIMLITIVTAGLPVAVSKLVAESEAKKDLYMTKKILRISLTIVLIASFSIAFLFYLLIPFISNYLLTDKRVYYTLLAIVPIIPIISVSAIIRGYFQGKQNMIPSATSTIIETIFRLIFGISLSLIFLPFGVEYTSAGAMIGMVIGEIVGLITLIIHYKINKNKKIVHKSSSHSNENIYTKISRIAIPVTTSQIIGSFAYFIEPSVVAHSLALAGIQANTATALYGQLAGMALLIITFPTVITYSLSQSLIPAVSEAAAKKDYRAVYKRLHQALNIAYIIGFPSVVFMYIFADEIAIALFAIEEVGNLIKIISPFAIFLYLQKPLAATLQGLDKAKIAMKNSIIGSFIKTFAIFILASRQQFGIDGVAMAISIGMLLVTTLHFRSVIKIIGYTIQIKPIFLITISSLAMGYSSNLLMLKAFTALPLGIGIVLSFLVGAIIYLYLLLFFKIIERGDFNKIPWLGEKLARILP